MVDDGGLGGGVGGTTMEAVDVIKSIKWHQKIP
jgi:hypothetical protein